MITLKQLYMMNLNTERQLKGKEEYAENAKFAIQFIFLFIPEDYLDTLSDKEIKLSFESDRASLKAREKKWRNPKYPLMPFTEHAVKYMLEKAIKEFWEQATLKKDNDFGSVVAKITTTVCMLSDLLPLHIIQAIPVEGYDIYEIIKLISSYYQFPYPTPLPEKIEDDDNVDIYPKGRN
jgi:hypothetical protein